MSVMRQTGDTIVEVIFAITIFSMVGVGGLTVMQKGAAIAQQSLEVSLVREQMDSQADALRYAHDAYVANFGNPDALSEKVWSDITAKADKSAHPFSDMSDGKKCVLPPPTSGEGAPFALDIRKLDGNEGNALLAFPTIPATMAVPVSDVSGVGSRDDFTTTTFAQMRYQLSDGTRLATAVSQGLWIQAVHEARVTGSAVPGYYDFHIRACWLSPGQSIPVTLGTIVRLYDPA